MIGDEAERERAEGSTVDVLAWADRFDTVVRRRSRWYVRYLVAFGFVALGGTAVPGFVSALWAGAIFAAAFGGFGVAIVISTGREPTLARGYLRRHAVLLAVWTIVFLTVIGVGVVVFPQDPAWWLPGAAAASLPFFLGAYLEARRNAATTDDRDLVTTAETDDDADDETDDEEDE